MTNDEIDFNEQIERFKDHDKQSQELYDTFKQVFDIGITRTKNSLSFSGGLRDLSEAAKSLSSIRGDAISATNHTFNAKMKIAEYHLKKDRSDKDNDDVATAALLMRNLTESIHKNRQSIVDGGRHGKGNVDTSTAKLKERVNADMSSGAIKLSNNDLSMKYDFKNSVSYAYDKANEIMVVLNVQTGEIIPNYPLERIPEGSRYNKTINGIPMDNSGREIKQI